jgi:hypothetical protein
MSYEIDLERDTDRGLDRYRITVADEFDSDDADELADWVTAAAQNPTAAFTIDVRRVREACSGPISALTARSAWLRERVEVVGLGLVAPLV